MGPGAWEGWRMWAVWEAGVGREGWSPGGWDGGRGLSDGGWQHVMTWWGMSVGGGGGGQRLSWEEVVRSWSEALEPFLETWGLADTGESARVEEGSGC